MIGGYNIKQVKINLLSTLVIVAILIGGCAKTNIPTPAPDSTKPNHQVENSIAIKNKPSDFFPLTKGSTWQYKGEGNEYASFTREVIFTKDNLAQVREDNGGTVSASVFKSTDNEIVRTFFQGEEAYGEINLLEQKSNDELIVLKAPLEVGTKWENSTGMREIVDVNASVETPAGRFEKCIVVKITSPDSTLYEYFHEGVGMVKREFTSGETRITSILEKYNIEP